MKASMKARRAPKRNLFAEPGGLQLNAHFEVLALETLQFPEGDWGRGRGGAGWGCGGGRGGQGGEVGENPPVFDETTIRTAIATHWCEQVDAIADAVLKGMNLHEPQSEGGEG